LQNNVEVGPYSLLDKTWKYFRFNVLLTESISIAVTQTSSSGDVDFYVQFGAIPTRSSYVLSNTQSFNPSYPTEYINMTAPSIGQWYVGCYGYRAATFKIKMFPTRGCADDCSGPSHGSCVGSRCSCAVVYSGSYCEYFRPLVTLGAVYTGKVGLQGWNYYKVEVNSINALVLYMNHSSNEDCDLYVNELAYPTLTNYTFFNRTAMSVTKIEIPRAGNTIHYVGIYGYSHCVYRFSASLEGTNQTCHCVHGRCANGLCICDIGYAGVSCNTSDTNLVNGRTISNVQISANQWHYYNYSFRDTSQIFMVLKEISNIGLLQLYFQYNFAPTLSFYISKETNYVSLHRIAVTFAQRTRDFNRNNTLTFILGVYGTPSIPFQRTVSYNIVAWSPPF